MKDAPPPPGFYGFLRTVRIMFRKKGNGRNTVKAFTNVRAPSRPKPIQLHVGYIMLRPEITTGDRAKLLRNLRRVWWMNSLDQWGDLEIDWVDAERKLGEFYRRAHAGPPLEEAGREDLQAKPARDSG